MMILRSSPASPFGRKVKIALSLLGLKDKVRVDVADTMDPNEALRKQNPLGKIPALITETGKVIYDSHVIVEYLDYIAGGHKVIPAGEARFDALTLHALADGIMEAALLKVYEGRFRDAAQHNAAWLAHHDGKIERGLAALEAHPPAIG
ncbi:MAG: glutathione S-transferase family protein, partial [Beijerinckiaceae bacterium]